MLPTQILDTKPDGLLDKEFAANPIGSGPYVYWGRRTEDGKEFAVFKANRSYGSRPGRIFLLKTGDKFHGTLQLVSARGGVERQILDAHHQVAVSDGDQKPDQLFVAGGINTEINRLFGQLSNAATGADRLIVDPYAAGLGVVVEPLRINRVWKSRTCSGQIY